MYIKWLSATMRDIFLGIGWTNWSRYELKDGKWKWVAGLRHDSATHRAIVHRLENPNYRRK